MCAEACAVVKGAECCSSLYSIFYSINSGQANLVVLKNKKKEVNPFHLIRVFILRM